MKEYVNKTMREEEQDIQNLQAVIERNKISIELCGEIIAVKKQKLENQRFYNSKEWKTIRNLVVERDQGMDVWEYLTTGRIVYPDRVDVHHIQELNEAPELRCDMSNLITVSHDNHRLIDALYRRGDKKKIQKILQDDVKRRNLAFFGNKEGTGMPVANVDNRQLSLFDDDLDFLDDEDDDADDYISEAV